MSVLGVVRSTNLGSSNTLHLFFHKERERTEMLHLAIEPAFHFLTFFSPWLKFGAATTTFDNHELDDCPAKPDCRHKMTFALVGLIVIWICGLLFLAGQHLNNIRLVLNSIAPEARSADQPSQFRLLRAAVTTLPFTLSAQDLVAATSMLLIGRSFGLDRSNAYRITSIDPAVLTVAGRVHLKRTIRQEGFLIGWMLVGFVLLVLASTCFLSS